MNFILNYIFFLLLIIFASCSKEQPTLHKTLNITLLDEVNNRPIDSAQVILIEMSAGADNLWSDAKYTDNKGACIFTFELDQQAYYRLIAEKEGYWNYLVDDSASVSRSRVNITESSETEQVLYLTSDSIQNGNYWRNKMPRYEMDSLDRMLRTNSYNSKFPYLIWDDIPYLLENANDTTILTKFPHNVLSSYSQDSCYLGVISMWLIESIRITESTGTIGYFGNLPSLNPILKYQSRTEFRHEINNQKEMKQAYDLYMQWWEEVKNMDSKEACKIAPLEHSELEW